MKHLAPYRKFAAAAITAVVTAAVTWLTTGQLDSTAIAALVTSIGAAAVYLVTNEPPVPALLPSTLAQTAPAMTAGTAGAATVILPTGNQAV